MALKKRTRLFENQMSSENPFAFVKLGELCQRLGFHATFKTKTGKKTMMKEEKKWGRSNSAPITEKVWTHRIEKHNLAQSVSAGGAHV